ncbi:MULTISPECIES: membrane-targeted effector domain-containing toxin [Pseudomonas]|uniref:Membrane-targeted effector domain-containing toxin n=1 Tax=Pseudomonas mosselii TaxID=78327 RepID=A0A5R8ZCR2_9PSED|nr:membrane-targeted effector domain-containing toxin [Pseudomonas mosselii]TLP63284.1 membrane-targeted effector domain-containing toxin [Pseudomonas mosselii]
MGLQLPMSEVQQHLRELAQSLITACPDMRQMARDTAIAILHKHGQPALNPDHVHLNRFQTAQSSPRTFSGWEHHDAPIQSFTLPQLVMHRFDVQDQDNSDLLSYLAGFYKDGPGRDVYDEHNEIPIQPKDVLEDFWQIDFSRLFHEQLETFWQRSSDSYRLLAKVNFLAKVVEVCAAAPDSALAHCAREVATALTGLNLQAPTLEQLHQLKIADAGYRVCTLDIAGYVASDWLRIEMQDGRQLLYTPGEETALQLFAGTHELYWWVLNHTNYADNRTRFMSHFPLSANDNSAPNTQLNHMIDLLFFNWGGHDHQCLNQLDTTVETDAFSHLRDAAQQRMRDDAHFALRSNGDLRKQLWIGYLEAFASISGPLAALDWPVALAAVGAGIADMGLSIDQAVNGHTTGERKHGVTQAIFAAIDTLFNAAMLANAAATVDVESVREPGLEVPADEPAPLEPIPTEDDTTDAQYDAREDEPASHAEIESWVPSPFRPEPPQTVLVPYQTNVILSASPDSGGELGIYLQGGDFYALIDQQPYQVRYVKEMQTWVVVDPENPWSFYRHIPIAMNAQGQWQPLERAALKGGMIPRKLLNLWGRVAPRGLPAPLAANAYEIPLEMRPTLKAAANSPHQDLALSGGLASLDEQIENSYATFRSLRDKLASDAQAFLDAAQPPARPALPELPSDAPPKQVLRALLENSDGVVIGEGHSQLGSKQLLIDNMKLLRREKVKVLYLEHFMTDFHQADLDVFNRTGRMPADLRAYARNLDAGFGLDRTGRYTFENVLIEAQRNGIRVQAIDCMASYRQAWDPAPSPVIRQQMMNFYAHEVIAADQARAPGRWIALVGNSHANTFEGVLGVSELEGAIGLRVQDILIGQAASIEVDPGFTTLDNDMSLRQVKSDLRLQVPVRTHPPLGADLEAALWRRGNFTIDVRENEPCLIHRSNTGELLYTPILREGPRFYIYRPSWPWISERRLRNLAELRNMMQQHGLNYVRL